MSTSPDVPTKSAVEPSGLGTPHAPSGIPSASDSCELPDDLLALVEWLVRYWERRGYAKLLAAR